MFKLALLCLATIAVWETTGAWTPTAPKGWKIFAAKVRCSHCGKCGTGFCIKFFKFNVRYTKIFKVLCICKGEYRGAKCEIAPCSNPAINQKCIDDKKVCKDLGAPTCVHKCVDPCVGVDCGKCGDCVFDASRPKSYKCICLGSTAATTDGEICDILPCDNTKGPQCAADRICENQDRNGPDGPKCGIFCRDPCKGVDCGKCGDCVFDASRPKSYKCICLGSTAATTDGEICDILPCDNSDGPQCPEGYICNNQGPGAAKNACGIHCKDPCQGINCNCGTCVRTNTKPFFKCKCDEYHSEPDCIDPDCSSEADCLPDTCAKKEHSKCGVCCQKKECFPKVH